MKERNVGISQRDPNSTSVFNRFLWWLSTADKVILEDSVIDRGRYSIIGLTVLGTWLFASFAWAFFFSTIMDSWFLAILPGIFMGFIILNIDRALIKGITRENKRKFTPLLFRGLLALTIGTFMAQPAVLFMFDKEIRLQTSLDNEKKKIQKRHELDLLYGKQLNDLKISREKASKMLEQQYDEVKKARENYLAETDGSGGSGKVGIKDIALAKKNEYEKLDATYQKQFVNQQSIINDASVDIKKIEASISREEENFTAYLNDGFLTRIDALENILKDNTALRFRYYLIIFILMLIELMPVIAKTLLPSGSYDEKVKLREEMEIAIARINAKQAQELKEHYNQLSFISDKALISDFFSISSQDRLEKLRSYSNSWKENENQSFDRLWEKMKNELLSRQEN